MHERTVDDTQRTWARVAGYMYLFNYATALLGTFVPGRILGSGSFAEMAQRALASEHLYRGALTSMTISWILIVVLAFGLYVALEPVNRRLAQLALFMELGQAIVGCVTVLARFATLRLRLNAAAPAGGPFTNDQLEALVSITGSVSGSGFQIAMTLLGVGSTLFFYLFHRSRFIPRFLASWGVFASVLFTIVSLLTLIFPAYERTLQYGWAPMALAEVGTALWLVIVGIRPAPVSVAKPA